MKHWQARKLSPQKFKRLYGIEKRTFRLMVRLVKCQEKQKKKPGRPPKIIIENQVLITLQYWREYRTYFHIAQDWNSEFTSQPFFSLQISSNSRFKNRS